MSTFAKILLVLTNCPINVEYVSILVERVEHIKLDSTPLDTDKFKADRLDVFNPIVCILLEST
jgi:hypothetical protein